MRASFLENPMNNLELKATRQGLGLEVAQAAELVSVQKRTFNYWEQGTYSIPNDVDLTFSVMAGHYALILDFMLADIEAATIHNADDDTKPSTIKPVLPYFRTFEQFQVATECPHVVQWRIYQSVISHLLLIGKITKLDDAATIPPEFRIWRWFSGEYEESNRLNNHLTG